MIDKTYEPRAVEGRIYEAWLAANAFAAGAGAKPGAEPYSIVIPPPNVTGSLHIGHALNNTLQDILIRFERMRGKDVLWQPGTDHAGIATQMIVERKLAERQESRRDLGRAEFLRRVWEWKAESGGTIMNQLKRLGASADFSREKFTMGETGAPEDQMVRAVTAVFVELHKRGLIYRAKRLVNWHPGLETAISDLEVENIEVNGKMWHLRYPIEGTGDYIVVATTRPETMLGDTGVAVHPEDERYKHLIGKHVILPLVGRRIPIVADEYADQELGSGAVKITPAHDFNDFEVGQRQNLEAINIFDSRARIHLDRDFYLGLTDRSQADLLHQLEGKDRFEAREMVLEALQGAGFLDHVEDKKIMVPHDQKSQLVIIEPYLTDQWWVKADVLAGPAKASVRQGRTKFVPQQYENTYFAWMDNIKPWCISRQLWWGHRIPAWYGRRQMFEGNVRAWGDIRDPEIFVAGSEEEAVQRARDRYKCEVVVAGRVPLSDTDAVFNVVDDADANNSPRVEVIWRDEDVLDTWFSSALWPFSTLGWPDETPALKRYYPTSTLVTGFDIIFFWVARMMMMGLEFMGKEPFETVYIHALVRDEQGAKMSKTKGNVIDPLELIEGFGADATRFTLAAMAAQGRDLKLSMNRVEGYRNFVTKLWNAARFLEINSCARVAGFDPHGVKTALNQWIVGETARAVASVTTAIEEFRFNEAANNGYDFVWGRFCDWYVELAKPVLTGEDVAARDETRATASWVLDQILKLLHPFMPFVTEELWAETGKAGPARDTLLILAEWPDSSGLENPEADAELNWLVDLISGIRSVRTEMNVPAGAKIPLVVIGAGDATRARLGRQIAALTRLARIETADHATEVPKGSAQIILGEATFALPLAGIIDIEVEKARLGKDVGKLDDEIGKIEKKLGNEQFLAKAAEDVVEEQRERLAGAEDRRNRIRAALARLS